MTGATIGITLAVFVVSVLVARWFNGKLDELEARIKQATDALKEADDDRTKQRARAVTAEGRLRSALTKVERLEAEAAKLLASRERHVEALANQIEECDRLTAALAEGDRPWVEAIAAERPKHHPSGAVARALNGVERAVRGEG